MGKKSPLKLKKKKELRTLKYLIDPKGINLIWISKEARKKNEKKVKNLYYSGATCPLFLLLSVYLLYSFTVD